MLHRKHFRYTAFYIFKALAILLTVGNLLGLWFARFKEKDESSVFHEWMRLHAEPHAWNIVTISSLGAAGCLGMMKLIGHPRTWDTIHGLLNGLQQEVFSGAGYEIADEHKVTIYKAVRCRKYSFFNIPLAKIGMRPRWLKPVARSGHTQQKTVTRFSIGDDGEKCQGAAGQAWRRGETVTVFQLPDVSNGSPGKRDLNDYSVRGWVAVDWIKEHKPKARALIAIPIAVKGEPWGSLVFDSKNPQELDFQRISGLFSVVSELLNNLIERHL